jgi:hypothetical protein
VAPQAASPTLRALSAKPKKSSLATSEVHTKTTYPPQIVHVFRTEKSTILVRSHPKLRRKNKSNPSKNLKLTTTHHSSPQKPNNRFIHKKVVSPPLLTFVSPDSPPSSPCVLDRKNPRKSQGRRVHAHPYLS